MDNEMRVWIDFNRVGETDQIAYDICKSWAEYRRDSGLVVNQAAWEQFLAETFFDTLYNVFYQVEEDCL